MNILFVCLGNICRSPMAEFIAKDIVKNKQLSNIKIDSCGTSGYHNGEDMHHGTKSLLKSKSIYCEGFISKQINNKLVNDSDYILVMDDKNYNDVVKKFSESTNKIFKITDFSNNKYNYVPDPWYTGNFEEVYKILYGSINNFLINKFY